MEDSSSKSVINGCHTDSKDAQFTRPNLSEFPRQEEAFSSPKTVLRKISHGNKDRRVPTEMQKSRTKSLIIQPTWQKDVNEDRSTPKSTPKLDKKAVRSRKVSESYRLSSDAKKQSMLIDAFDSPSAVPRAKGSGRRTKSLMQPVISVAEEDVATRRRCFSMDPSLNGTNHQQGIAEVEAPPIDITSKDEAEWSRYWHFARHVAIRGSDSDLNADRIRGMKQLHPSWQQLDIVLPPLSNKGKAENEGGSTKELSLEERLAKIEKEQGLDDNSTHKLPKIIF
eukprot:Seg1254.12 transcript_id=Seg1254.12/GoldUCD/mRNA.D3Y31 product="hypothetical protein" protein_id=Seg1254.12/GoldUCD/D3Y31